jgi:hypothetical protein
MYNRIETSHARHPFRGAAPIPMLSHMRLVLLFTLTAVSALAQEPLRQQIRAIAREAHGKVCQWPAPCLAQR